MHSLCGVCSSTLLLLVCLRLTSVHAVTLNNTVTKDCSCSPTGSLNTTCDNVNTTASCICLAGYQGANCTDCQNGYYHHSNSSDECDSCQCHETGSLNTGCDRYGWCPCKHGYGGRQCNQCLSGYYRLPASGCRQCSCEVTTIKCLLNASKSKDSIVASTMCQRCQQNVTWIGQCLHSICSPSQYLMPDGNCTSCQCSHAPDRTKRSRQCDLMTGKCPKCEGASCLKGEFPTNPPDVTTTPAHFKYRAYIIASGAITGLIVVALIILLTIYCRRRYRRGSRRTPLPLWTIELRRDDGNNDDDQCDTTQDLSFTDVDVMYLDDSYLMESSEYNFTESTNSINGRAGYHTLS